MKLEKYFAADGPFAALIDGYLPREAQTEMARAVADTIDANGVLVAEAGTGTGKTFAYLIPAILSGKKVVISTGTRNLQDQLFNKDIPLVRKALKTAVDVALLKGRGNYLCHHRLRQALAGKKDQTRSEIHDIQIIRQWSGSTKSGDIAECYTIAESAPIWQKVTSTADNCLGSECDDFNNCHLNLARRAALDADVVVINHHLFFADRSLRDERVVELLPDCDCYIFDEAHQLYDTASHFYGVNLGSNQLLELSRDVITEDSEAGAEDRRIRLAAEQLEKTVREFRSAFDAEPKRGTWGEVAEREAICNAVVALQDQLADLTQLLQPQSDRSKGLESCFQRSELFTERLQAILSVSEVDQVAWYETHLRSFSLHATPLDISNRFRSHLLEDENKGWVFASATLAVGESFDHFTRQLGLPDSAVCKRWSSPFNYRMQSLLYVPEQLPAPMEQQYTEIMMQQVLPVIEMSGGGVFILFTSYRALELGRELLQDKIAYPLLVQGDGARNQLLEQFRELGNAVLLGTGSFWEGIDVRGEALTCVIIDKLPFSSPSDPLLQARIDRMRQQGLNPFMDYQLPQAVISLKQGVGRLIRDITDYGVLVLCDPRLISKSYGSIFIDSLPQMTRTRRLDVVERFYKHHRPSVKPEKSSKQN